MKMRKAYTILLAAAMCLSLLCISAAAAAKDDAGDSNSEDIIKSETLGVVVVKGDGKYDFGDGTTVTIEPIPWLMDEDSDDAGENGECETETVKIYVNGDGRYDLGNGAVLVIEPIPEDEMGISPHLHESDSSFPLTDEWTHFCSDDPFFEPVLKVYNNSKRNPGNLNVQVGFLQ